MLEFLIGHWLLLLIVAAGSGLLIRTVLRQRARRRQLEQWAADRRQQREREQREEEERRQRAQELAAAKLCRTEDELARALGNGLDEISIEGVLTKTYAQTIAAHQDSSSPYRVVLARHGKVILRRA